MGAVLRIFEVDYESFGVPLNNGKEFWFQAAPKKLLTIVYHDRSHTIVRC